MEIKILDKEHSASTTTNTLAPSFNYLLKHISYNKLMRFRSAKRTDSGASLHLRHGSEKVYNKYVREVKSRSVNSELPKMLIRLSQKFCKKLHPRVNSVVRLVDESSKLEVGAECANFLDHAYRLKSASVYTT